jgi:hypothetical protein
MVAELWESPLACTLENPLSAAQTAEFNDAT